LGHVRFRLICRVVGARPARASLSPGGCAASAPARSASACR
jgi:hypothetical protein